ncbi:stalk domain-containing protein [Cohnella herbarum]|uniref:Copper amine oxidase n=1 Tax=Cohnella herbarum TaxID=2728023 RepID=A0A7Z2VQ74_9BACL|nr:stalk domain-containing protein [Cohnella herbarum]QJD87166.1 copper amine oxidase [Cohnella herbarum]
MKFKSRKPFTALIASLLALSVVPSVSAADNAAAVSKDAYRIVALGDSLSVGFEPLPEIINQTSAPYGYVDRLFDQSLFRDRSEMANYAILGLTTKGLNNLLQGAADQSKLTSADLQDFSSFAAGVAQQADQVAAKTPELAADLGMADLVVLTIGGNDFTAIINDAKDKPIESARQIIQDSFLKTMNNYTEDLDKMMTILHELAPNAQIVVADQYLPLFKGHELYPDLLQVAKKLTTELDTFANGLSKKGIPLKIAHVSEKFVGNEASYTYFNMMENFDIHPKQAGYEAMAQAFSQTIWGEYLKPAPRAADVPLSVVINGKEIPSKPVTVNNTTFLALRDVANAVKADLKWTQKTKTAVFTKDGREVVITIGSKTILINGVTKPLDHPAYFQQDGKTQKTYVPLAVISEGLDFQVVFRKKLMTAFINL